MVANTYNIAIRSPVNDIPLDCDITGWVKGIIGVWKNHQ